MKAICIAVCLTFLAVGAATAQTNVTTTGGTANSVPKFSGSSAVVNSAITEVNGNVGIGTTNPNATLTIQGTNVSAFVFGYGVNGQDFTPTLGTFTSEGTPSSPSPVLAGDRLLSLYNAAQYDTTPGHTISGASIDFFADENYAPNRNGADIRFLTAVNGSGNGRLERMRIDNTGDVGIGTTTPSQKLEVNGSIKLTASSGGSLIFADGTKQSTATLQGPQGPAGATGPQGPQGPAGPPGPGSTSAVCFSLGSSIANSCSCNIRLVSQTLMNANTNGSCTATSNTGSCSANAFANGPVSATCCVCAPN